VTHALTNEEIRFKAVIAMGWVEQDFSLKEWREAGFVTGPRRVWLEPGAAEIHPSWCYGLHDKEFPDPTTDLNDAFEFAKVLKDEWLEIHHFPTGEEESFVYVWHRGKKDEWIREGRPLAANESLPLAITLAVLEAIEQQEYPHAE
jgi:hypothetical protein